MSSCTCTLTFPHSTFNLGIYNCVLQTPRLRKLELSQVNRWSCGHTHINYQS